MTKTPTVANGPLVRYPPRTRIADDATKTPAQRVPTARLGPRTLYTSELTGPREAPTRVVVGTGTGRRKTKPYPSYPVGVTSIPSHAHVLQDVGDALVSGARDGAIAPPLVGRAMRAQDTPWAVYLTF